MPEQYSLVVTEKFRKGVQVRVITTGTREAVEQKRSEVKWVTKRGDPHIMKTEEVAAFTQQRRTGIFVPEAERPPAPTPEEIRAKAERAKAQEKFEREREAAKLPTREGEIARQLLKSKYGITVKPPKEIVVTPAELEKIKAEESKARQERLFKKQAFRERVAEVVPRLKFDTVGQAISAGYEVREGKIPTTRQEFATSLYERQKEKGFVPERRKIVAPERGGYAIIPETAKAYPEHFEGLRLQATEPSLPLFARETIGKLKRQKGYEAWEEKWGKRIKAYKKGEKYLQQKMPEWFPGLKKMRTEATRERIRLKEKEGLKAKIQYRIYGVAKGVSRVSEKEPQKAIAYAIAFYALPPVLAVGGLALKAAKIGKVAPTISKASQKAMEVSAKYLPPRIVPTAKAISKVVPPKVYALPRVLPKAIVYGGLPALYGAGVYQEVKYAPEPSVKFGEILGGEIGPMFIGGYAGIRTVKKMREVAIARKPVKVELKTAADIAVEELPTKKVAKLAPIDFVAEIGKRKYVGVGAGRVDITQFDTRFLTKGIFKYGIKDVTAPTAPRAFEVTTGTRGLYIQTDYGFKGGSVIATELKGTQVGARLITSKAVSVTRGIQVMGGEYPVTVLKTAVFKPTYPITPTEARFGITKKIAEKIEPRVFRYEMKYTPEEYGELLVKRGELKGIYERKLGKERAIGLYYEKGRFEGEIKPSIEIDPRLFKTRAEARKGLVKRIIKKPHIFVKSAFLHPKVTKEFISQELTMTKPSVLRHELLHHMYPKASEKYVGEMEIKLRGKPFKEIELKKIPVKTEYFKFFEKGMGAPEYIRKYETQMYPYSAEAMIKRMEVQRLLRGKKGQILLQKPKPEIEKPKGLISEEGIAAEQFRTGIGEAVRAAEIARLPKVRIGVYGVPRAKTISDVIAKQRVESIAKQAMKPIAKQRLEVKPALVAAIESGLRIKAEVGVIGKQAVRLRQKMRMRPALKQIYRIGEVTPTPFMPGPPPPPPWIPRLPLPKPGKIEKKRRKGLLPFGREYDYSPSLSWVLGGRGVVATPAQRVGKVAISPLMIRALPKRRI